MRLVLVLLIALGLASAIVLIIRGAVRTPERPPLATRSTTANLLHRIGLTGSDPATRARRRNALIGVGVGVLAWLVSGWIILVPLGPVAGLLLPLVLGKPAGADRIKLLTALESWCRSLAGLFTGANVSPELAIESSLPSAPPELQGSIARVVSRLARRQPLDEAMRLWARELDDREADTVALAIIQGSQLRQGGIAPSLTALAGSISKRVEAQHDSDAEREGPLTTIRWVTMIGALFLVLGMLNPSYSEPFSTPSGQVVLAVLIGAFLAALFWLRRIAFDKPPARLLLDRREV